MCEPTLPIEDLKKLRYDIMSLADFAAQGSHGRANMEMALRGIKDRIEWIIANLEKANEGKKNFGLSKTYIEGN